MLDQILKKQLERDEGRRLRAYRDSRGYWTIGVGHLLGSTPRMSDITENECDALLSVDIDIAERACRSVFGASVFGVIGNAARCRALLNMAFNRGEGHMRDSTTITPAIKQALTSPFTAQAWVEVAKAIRQSPWAVQIGARATRLAKQFEDGEDQ
jgi:Straboviridae endolysin